MMFSWEYRPGSQVNEYPRPDDRLPRRVVTQPAECPFPWLGVTPRASVRPRGVVGTTLYVRPVGPSDDGRGWRPMGTVDSIEFDR